MRLPRVRFTIWRMMIAIAVLALALGGSLWGLRMRRLAHRYADQAKNSKVLYKVCRGVEASCLDRARDLEDRARKLEGDRQSAISPFFEAKYRGVQEEAKRLATDNRRDAERLARKAAHYAALNRKIRARRSVPLVMGRTRRTRAGVSKRSELSD